jgi:hypothetical protein
MSLPSGRAAFLERIDVLMAGEAKEQTPPTDPLDRLRDDILSQWSNQLQLIEAGILNANQDTARTQYRAPAGEMRESPATEAVKPVTADYRGDTVMWNFGRVSLARLIGAGLLAAAAAAPIDVHAQAYLLPAFKECLAKAEQGGEGAPTRSQCYWQHQTAQSDNGP